MSIGASRVFPASVNSGASLSSSIDLGGGFLYVSVEIPASGANPAFSTAAGSPLWVQGSTDGTNFRRMTEILTAVVTNDFSVASSVSNRMVPVPSFNFRYLKLEVSGTVTGAATGGVAYKIIVSDAI